MNTDQVLYLSYISRLQIEEDPRVPYTICISYLYTLSDICELYDARPSLCGVQDPPPLWHFRFWAELKNVLVLQWCVFFFCSSATLWIVIMLWFMRPAFWTLLVLVGIYSPNNIDYIMFKVSRHLMNSRLLPTYDY